MSVRSVRARPTCCAQVNCVSGAKSIHPGAGLLPGEAPGAGLNAGDTEGLPAGEAEGLMTDGLEEGLEGGLEEAPAGQRLQVAAQ